MTVDPKPDETEETPPRHARRGIGERVRSSVHRLIRRIAPPDDETERTPLRTGQKIGVAVIALGALGFWSVLLYLIVT